MLNKIILIGHLGKDPETLRTRNSGEDYARFSIATTERWTDRNSGQKREKTEWHNVVVWDKRIFEVVRKYLKKGSKVYLEGKMTTRKYTDKQGVDRWASEVVLQSFGDTLELLDQREGDHVSEPEAPYGFDADDYQAAKDGEPRKSEHSERSVSAELNDEIPF